MAEPFGSAMKGEPGDHGEVRWRRGFASPSEIMPGGCDRIDPMPSDPTRVLCTSARMPFAVDEIRKLVQAGHDVYASDTFKTSPGLHVRGLAGHLITPPPTQETDAFVDAVAETITNHGIDVVLPMFEDVFYLTKHRARLEPLAGLFFPTLETLLKFHSKANFVQLCQQIGVPVPDTLVVHDDAELAAAIAEIPQYFARASFSRGGVDILTDVGPLAETIAVSDIHPTEENPWVVQGFVEGIDLCSYSVVHEGKVALHVTYEHPRTIEHAGGIIFESVDEPDTLDHVRRFAEATRYTGQVSFDYLKHPDGLVSMVECNPRPTAGLSVVDHDTLSAALFAPAPDTIVIPAGQRAQIDSALIRDAFREPKNLPQDVRDLFAAPDIYLGAKDGDGHHDLGPFVYQALSLTHLLSFRHQQDPASKHRKHTALMAAQFYDIEWDGSPIG